MLTGGILSQRADRCISGLTPGSINENEMDNSGVLPGVHVTGFTALMDRFSLTCKSEHDMDKLAHIFSHYISDIVERLSSGQISQVIVGDQQRQYLLLCEQYMFEVEIMKEDEAVKGYMFFCVFGLPGDKKPDECAYALESSVSIFNPCWENLDETKNSSKPTGSAEPRGTAAG
ncbi:Adenylate cyclase type 10 [Manis javanica]|nr:Adenylate cyclase type 10 [Manis javanica]